MHDNLYMCMSATSNNGVYYTAIGLSISVSIVLPGYSSHINILINTLWQAQSSQRVFTQILDLIQHRHLIKLIVPIICHVRHQYHAERKIMSNKSDT